MAGYKYRATDAKIRAAEELMRSRGINDVQADATKPTPVMAAPAPAAKNGDVFEVVKETPRPVRMPRRAGTVRVAAASAVKVLEESPGEWFRSHNEYTPDETELRDSYAASLHEHAGEDYTTAKADAERGIAKIKADALREAAEAWRKHLLATDASYVCAESWLTVRAYRIEEEA